MPEKQTQKNDIAQLIQLGREQGYLTHADITDTLPDGSTDADNFEEITQVLRDMGIKVFEDTPDQDGIRQNYRSSKNVHARNGKCRFAYQNRRNRHCKENRSFNERSACALC